MVSLEAVGDYGRVQPPDSGNLGRGPHTLRGLGSAWAWGVLAMGPPWTCPSFGLHSLGCY